MTSTSFCSLFYARFHQRRYYSAGSRGPHDAARRFVLIGVLSALLCPNWGFRYSISDVPDIDLSTPATFKHGGMTIEVVDAGACNGPRIAEPEAFPGCWSPCCLMCSFPHCVRPSAPRFDCAYEPNHLSTLLPSRPPSRFHQLMTTSA